jgi:hypothetical protein
MKLLSICYCGDWGGGLAFGATAGGLVAGEVRSVGFCSTG